MNTINTNSSNLTNNNKFTNEIKSSFLVADILDKKTTNNSKVIEDDEDEKIDIEDDGDIKTTIKLNENAINLSSNKVDKSPIRDSNSVDSNKLNQLNQLNQLNSLNQLNHQLSNQLNNQLNNLNPLSSINPSIHQSEHESLLNSIYARLFEAKQFDPNLLIGLNQNKNLNDSKQHKPNLINSNLNSPLLTNSITNLIKTNSNQLNENQLTNATGKFNFSSLFNTHPHLFAQSLEAMAAASESSFSNQQIHNLSQMSQNFSHLASNYTSVLMPSTSKLSSSNPLTNPSILEQLSRNSQSHLQVPSSKELINTKTKFTLPNQPNAIDLIKQFQSKMHNQHSDDTKFDKTALNLPVNPLLFNSTLNPVYDRNTSAEPNPDTLNKLCSNFNLQQILYHQHLQDLQKQAYQYPLQNGNLNAEQSDSHNPKNYLMNNFLSNQDKQIINNFTNHQEEDEEVNGISRTNSPASSHSSAIAQFNNDNSVQMTTFHPSMDYTWVCHSKQLQRKRTVFTLYQRTQLEETFNQKRYISKSDRVILAKKIGLNDSQIKVWFINRRTKFRNLIEQQKLKKRES